MPRRLWDQPGHVRLLASGPPGDTHDETRAKHGAALAIGALLIALPGCQKQEGPAEKAGKEVDKAMEQTGAKVEHLGERIQDAAQGKPADADQK